MKTFLSAFSAMFLAAGLCCAFSEDLPQTAADAVDVAETARTEPATRRLEDIFPADVCAALRENGVIRQSRFKQENLSYPYLPSGDIEKEIRDFWPGKACSYVNETVFLYKKPDAKAGTMETVELVLKSVSDLEGIMYFSNSRQEDRLLYKRAYCIADADSKQKIPDPVDRKTDGLSVLVLQEDLTFGENLYQFAYRKSRNQIALFYENRTALKMAFLDVIKPENMKNVLLVEDLGDELLFYGLVRANYISFPGLKNRINASLSSRMDAMYDWFISSYEKYSAEN